MSKVFNVWVIIEKIDEEHDENGKDIRVSKLAQFKKEKEADKYFDRIVMMD